MEQIALGVVVLNRVNKLEHLLDSASEACIDTVYIGDNGRMNEKKEQLYHRDFPFELEVLDLEYDAGLGYSRDAIVKQFEEEFLLVADSDHRISSGVSALRSVLEAKPELGGVAGTIIEPNRGEIWQSAKDFYEKDQSLIRSAHAGPAEVEMVNGTPFRGFDFTPYPAMYRRKCLEDYSWDPEYPLGRAHVDFYVGHWKQTDWSFGVCPNIFFEHYPGGDPDYTSHRRDEKKYQYAKSYFCQKWGYDEVRSEKAYWFDTFYDNRTLLRRAYQSLESDGIGATVRRSLRWLGDNATISGN